jgi:hypothetical protein
MKRDALSHPKTLELASRLDTSRAHAIGVLTLLWDFCATYTPQGDIGRHRNGAIARACEWMDNPDEFVTALIDAGWLDVSEKHRVIVHDWPDHCESWVKAKLARAKQWFLEEYGLNPTSDATIEATTEPTTDATSDPTTRAPKPSLAKPSLAQTKPSQAKPSPTQANPQSVPTDDSAVDGGDFGDFDLGEVDQDELMRECLKLDRALIKRKLQVDADTLWRWGWVAVALGQHGLLSEVASKVHSGEVTKPKGYVEASLRRACTERGKDLIAVTRCVPPRPKPVSASV